MSSKRSTPASGSRGIIQFSEVRDDQVDAKDDDYCPSCKHEGSVAPRVIKNLLEASRGRCQPNLSAPNGV